MGSLNILDVKSGTKIKYTGDSWTFGGSYTVVTAESTYADPNTMPESEKGKLMIIEFTNDDRAMYFNLDSLNPSEWVLLEE